MTDTPPQEAAAKPQRSALVVFTQTTLMLEALAVFFATLVVWGLARADVVDVDEGLVWIAGPVLAALFAFAAGRAQHRWARILGWVLHIPFIAAGWVLASVAVIGVIFLGVYALGVRLGARIDRERAERDAAGQDEAGQDA